MAAQCTSNGRSFPCELLSIYKQSLLIYSDGEDRRRVHVCVRAHARAEGGGEGANVGVTVSSTQSEMFTQDCKRPV